MEGIIKLIIIEDDKDWITVVKNSIKREKDMQVVAYASTFDDGITVIGNTEFDIALLDINITDNEFDGLNLIEHINKKGSKVIVLSSLELKEVIIDSYKRGIFQYIHKDNDAVLKNSIRQAMNENSPTEILSNEYKFYYICEEKQLTPSQMAIMRCIKEGVLKNDEISKKIYMTEDAIKKQVTIILDKFNCRNKNELLNKL